MPTFREHLPTIQWAMALFRRLGRMFRLAPAQIALYEGRLLQREGRWDVALARLQSVLQHAEMSGLRYVQALAHYWIAQRALEAGNQALMFDSAQVLLRTAARIFRSLGAAWELRRCETALSSLAAASHA